MIVKPVARSIVLPVGHSILGAGGPPQFVFDSEFNLGCGLLTSQWNCVNATIAGGQGSLNTGGAWLAQHPGNLILDGVQQYDIILDIDSTNSTSVGVGIGINESVNFNGAGIHEATITFTEPASDIVLYLYLNNGTSAVLNSCSIVDAA